MISLRGKDKLMQDMFLKFIDSKAIRTHCRSYQFAPSEQAVLIAQSRKRPVEEKLEVLEYLRDNFSEKDFEAEKVGMFGEDELMTFRERLAYYIDGLKKSLALKNASEGYVFITDEREEGDEYIDEKYYTSYADAYEDIVSRYKDNSYFFSEFRHEYRLRIMPEGSWEGVCHCFDNDLNLVIADPVLPNDEPPCLDISQYYVWLPLLFKKGDIVKARDDRSGWIDNVTYGVFYYPDDGSDDHLVYLRRLRRESGDCNDMSTILEIFTPSYDSALGGSFNFCHKNVLDLDYPDESDIDKIDYGTKLLAAALDDEYKSFRLIDLLKDYSHGYIANHKYYFDPDKYLKAKIKRLHTDTPRCRIPLQD